MEFPNGQTVFRHRYPLKTDPYNTQRQIADRSKTPATIPLPECFIASSSSVKIADATRSQLLTNKSLYLGDPDADVLPGDVIGTTDVVGDAEYRVDVVPTADINPFSGWQPVKEVPLEAVTG